MSSYLETIGPDATMKGLFDDLYGQAAAVNDELDRIRKSKYPDDPNAKEIPGTNLWFTFGMDTRRIEAGLHVPLLSLSSRPTHRGGPREPEQVAGFRGNELSGDYSLTLRPPTSVACNLRTFGLFRTGKTTDEPIGSNTEIFGQKVAGLAPEKHERLAVVAAGILDCITAVQLIKDGSDYREVLEAMGKPVDRR